MQIDTCNYYSYMSFYAVKNDREDMKLAVQNFLSEVNYLEGKPITEHVITLL